MYLTLRHSPQTLNIVALAIHADGDGVFDQHTRKGRAGELAALVRVEDVRFAVACESVLKVLDAECRLHRDR